MRLRTNTFTNNIVLWCVDVMCPIRTLSSHLHSVGVLDEWASVPDPIDRVHLGLGRDVVI